MKTRVRTASVFVIALLAAGPAFGLGGLLKEPGLSFSVPPASGETEFSTMKAPEKAQRFLKLLSDKSQKYVGGYFFNWETHLFYAGDSAKLDRFLDDLVKAGGRIHLHLSKAMSGTRLELGGDVMQTEPAQWEVVHNPTLGENRFDVTVYLGDGRIDPEKLHLELRSDASK